MTLPTQLAIAIVAGLTASVLIIATDLDRQPLLLVTTVLAACCAAPLLGRKRTAGAAVARAAVADEDVQDAGREEGEVKWFNVSKGFGFIRRQNGEEIFVHFRSIRDTSVDSEGSGRRRGSRERRALRDGQRVSFIVVDSEKGPQAEEVEAQ